MRFISVCLLAFLCSIVYAGVETWVDTDPVNPSFSGTGSFGSITATGGGTIGTWLSVGSWLTANGAFTVRGATATFTGASWFGGLMTFQNGEAISNSTDGRFRFGNNGIAGNYLDMDVSGSTAYLYPSGGINVQPASGNSWTTQVSGLGGIYNTLGSPGSKFYIAQGGQFVVVDSNTIVFGWQIPKTTNTIQTGDWAMPNNLSVAQTASATVVNVTSGTATLTIAIGAIPMHEMGCSFDAALKLKTPTWADNVGGYECWWSTDTYTRWVSTGLTVCGFRVISSGVTP